MKMSAKSCWFTAYHLIAVDFLVCRCLLGEKNHSVFRNKSKLSDGFKYCLFSPRKLGKMNPFWLYNIFQMGWSNHQLGKVLWDVWCQDICNPCYHHYLIVCGKFFSSFLYGASLFLRGAAGEACQRAQERDFATNFFSYKDRGKHPCFCDWKWKWADSIAFLLAK